MKRQWQAHYYGRNHILTSERFDAESLEEAQQKTMEWLTNLIDCPEPNRGWFNHGTSHLYDVHRSARYIIPNWSWMVLFGYPIW